MNVPSFAFLGFCVVAALLINISTNATWRQAIFLLANALFIGTLTNDPGQLVPFAVLLGAGFFSVKLMERYRKRAAFVVLVIGLIAFFCVLKRYAFVPSGLILTYPYLSIGLSYVFFRVLHLVIDAYQDALPHRVGLLSYANYTLNFTSLVSGPIQFYAEYDRMERSEPAELDRAAMLRAFERIVTGLFKVTVASPLLAYAHDRIVVQAAAGGTIGARTLDAALLLAIFPIYLYVNFSGYMDFVIGAARLLRLELPENFNHPFVSLGFIEFWSRWHMTLSRWLQTYVYSPLLLNLMRRFPARNVEPYLGVFAYFVTFFLVGLWHGPTSMFIFYGVLLGLGVSANKFYQIVMLRRLGRPGYRALCAQPLYAAVSRGLTFVWFSFSLLWFWSSWEQLGGFFHALGPAATASGFVLLLVAATIVLPLLRDTGTPQGGRWFERFAPAAPYVRVAWCTVLAIAVLSVAVLNAPAAHIVYRAF